MQSISLIKIQFKTNCVREMKVDMVEGGGGVFCDPTTPLPWLRPWVTSSEYYT